MLERDLQLPQEKGSPTVVIIVQKLVMIVKLKCICVVKVTYLTTVQKIINRENKYS